MRKAPDWLTRLNTEQPGWTAELLKDTHMSSQSQNMSSFYNFYAGVKYVVVAIFLFYAVDSF